MKKITNSQDFDQISYVFSESNITQAAVTEAGEKVFMVLYGAKKETSLNSLRQRKFIDKISVKLSHVDPASLPPTASAAKYHSLRAYLQVQQWKQESCVMNLEQWGWKLEEGEYVPVEMDLPPAPQELMQIICCGCNGDCSSRTCSCRKYSRECTFACSNCKGTACSNTKKVEFDDLIEVEEGTYMIVFMKFLSMYIHTKTMIIYKSYNI